MRTLLSSGTASLSSHAGPVIGVGRGRSDREMSCEHLPIDGPTPDFVIRNAGIKSERARAWFAKRT